MGFQFNLSPAWGFLTIHHPTGEATEWCLSSVEECHAVELALEGMEGFDYDRARAVELGSRDALRRWERAGCRSTKAAAIVRALARARS